MRVLLIEDDSATAQSIELMLKTESFNIYTTDLGEEGVDLGKLYDYDIILLDLNLPDMSGYEVLRTLRVARVKTPIHSSTSPSAPAWVAECSSMASSCTACSIPRSATSWCHRRKTPPPSSRPATAHFTKAASKATSVAPPSPPAGESKQTPSPPVIPPGKKWLMSWPTP
jgi:CheY-like chemotaxis protein